MIWIDRESGVELYIDTGDHDENKKIFDSLHAQKDKVEKAFAATLDWQRLDEKRASRVRYVMSTGGLMDGEQNWERIQDGMINAMDRLARAIKPNF